MARPGEDVGRQPIPESILAAVKRVPGVANTVADVETTRDQPVTVIGHGDHKPNGIHGRHAAVRLQLGRRSCVECLAYRTRPAARAGDDEIVVDEDRPQHDGQPALGTEVLVNEAPQSGSALPAECVSHASGWRRPSAWAQPARCSPTQRSPADHRSRQARWTACPTGQHPAYQSNNVARAHRRGPAIGNRSRY